MDQVLNVESLSSIACGGIDINCIEDKNYHFFEFNIPSMKQNLSLSYLFVYVWCQILCIHKELIMRVI